MRKAPVPTDGTDPASIIAQALKKKFAHRRRHDTNSPGIKKIGHIYLETHIIGLKLDHVFVNVATKYRSLLVC